MRIELEKVPYDRIVALPADQIEISPLFRGQLGMRLGGSISYNNARPQIDVLLIDSGRTIRVPGWVEVDYEEVVDEVPEFRGPDE